MGYFSSQRLEMLRYYSNSLGHVLELGCGEGQHGRILLERALATTVDGVDINPMVFCAASQNLSRFSIGSVVDYVAANDLTQYDTVLALDVLEHLVDPWEVVNTLARSLKPGTRVIASIPNIRYVPVVMRLLVRGRFRYEESGILDRTHLRFFTRDSIELLFAAPSFDILFLDRVRYPNQRKWVRPLVAGMGDLGCKQFVIGARVREEASGSGSGPAYLANPLVSPAA